MAASDLITLGIGPGGDIETLLTGGLELAEAVVVPATVNAGLHDRSLAPNLRERDIGVTMGERSGT